MSAEVKETVRETGLILRQLKREGRVTDMRKIVDQALVKLPWHPAYWWWKLLLQKGNAAGALEQWRTMSRMGIEKSPMHYEMMAELLSTGTARHQLFDLHKELRARGMFGSARFYRLLFSSCAGRHVNSYMAPKAKEIWRELGANSQSMHLTKDEALRGVYGQVNTNERYFADVPVPKPNQEDQSTDSSTSQAVSATQDQHTSGKSISADETQVASVPGRSASYDYAPRKIALDKILDPFYKTFHVDTIQHQEALGQARQLLHTAEGTDTSDYNRLVRSAARTRDSDDLMDILEEVHTRGLVPNAATYAPIVRKIFSEGRPDDALALVDQMETSGIPANMTVVKHVLQGLFENDRVEEAKLFFLSIVDENSTTRDTRNSIISNERDKAIEGFAIVMSGLCEAGKFEDATRLLPIMLREGLEPNERTYDPLIRAAFRQKRVPEAMKLYDLAVSSLGRLKESNLYWKADLDELAATVVSGYLNNDRETEATAFLIRIASEGLWHNTTPKPYIYFIARYAEDGRFDAAWNLFDLHKERFAAYPKYKLYHSILKSIYIHHHDLFGGVAWLEKMKSECEITEQLPFTDLLDSAMTSGERGIAERAWRDLQKFLAQKKQIMTKETAVIARKWGYMKASPTADLA